MEITNNDNNNKVNKQMNKFFTFMWLKYLVVQLTIEDSLIALKLSTCIPILTYTGGPARTIDIKMKHISYVNSRR